MLSFGANVPVPLLVHCPIPEPPVITPCNGIAPLLPQILVSFPADAIAKEVMEIITVSDAAEQPPLCVEVRTSLIVPAAVSALLKL